MSAPQSRKLAAILFADIVDYTALMQADEETALSALQKFHTELKLQVPKNQGEIIQFYGDGCLAVFTSSVDAVVCAKALQETFQSVPQVPVRIGLHAGDVVFRDQNVFGDAVNIASRIESMGISGSVLMSNNVRNQIKNKSEFELIQLGEFKFKNVEEGIQVYALRSDTLAIPPKNAVKGKLKPQKSKLSILMWVVAILALGFMVTYFSGAGVFPSDRNADDKGVVSIAVLPLENLNPEEENLDYFSNGVTQEIIDELTQISSLNVSPFSQSAFYSSQHLSPIEIAERLAVKYLISGTSRLLENGQRVKLSIELFNPSENKTLRRIPIDEPMDNVSFIQNTIAKRVVKELNINLSAAELARINKVATTSGSAFKLYLRAKSEINKFTEQGVKNTWSFLKEAIEIDPNFTNAYTLLAWSFVPGMASWQFPDLPPTAAIKAQAFPYINKAIELEANSSEPYLVRAGLRLFHDNDIRGAKSDIDQAISLNTWPNIPTDFCICTAVSTYVALEEAEPAKALAELASEIDPGNALSEWDKGNIHMISGEFEKAISQYKISFDKTKIPYWGIWIAFAYYHAQKYDDALHDFNFAINGLEKKCGFLTAYLSAVHFKKGDQVKSDAFKAELENRLAAGENHLNWPLAIVHMSRTEVGTALDYLEESVKKSENGLAFFTALDPHFDALSDHPRFREIRRQMNYYELKDEK